MLMQTAESLVALYMIASDFILVALSLKIKETPLP